MEKFIIKRLMYAILTLFIISSLTFFLIRLIPGNPIESMTEKMPEQVRTQIYQQYGFDQSHWVQYKLFWKQFIESGDLGESLKYRGRKVKDTILNYAPVSGQLGGQALVIGLIFGVSLGLLAGLNRGRRVDHLVTVIAILGVSIPSFILASLFQYYFAIKLNWFPIIGWEGFRYTILPSIALSFYSTAKYARYMRATCLEIVNQDYILTARAKGASEWRIVRKHIMRNSMMPIITLLGPQIAMMFGGSFVIENIFSIPGLGYYFVSSVSDRDYTMIMGQTLFMAALYIASLLLVDIVYGLVDPRVRVSEKCFRGKSYGK